MLMKPDKKNPASLIVGKLMGKPDDSESMDSEQSPMSEDGSAESDDSVAVNTAAEELMSAIEMKSAKGIVEAMRSLMELLKD